jgi:transposase
MARDCTAAQQLMQLMGVGEITATALVAMVGNAREFDSGRQLALLSAGRREQID